MQIYIDRLSQERRSKASPLKNRPEWNSTISVSPDPRLNSPDASQINSIKAESIRQRKPSLPKFETLKNSGQRKPEKRPQPPSNSFESCKYRALTSDSKEADRNSESKNMKSSTKPKVPTLKDLNLSRKETVSQSEEAGSTNGKLNAKLNQRNLKKLERETSSQTLKKSGMSSKSPKISMPNSFMSLDKSFADRVNHSHFRSPDQSFLDQKISELYSEKAAVL